MQGREMDDVSTKLNKSSNSAAGISKVSTKLKRRGSISFPSRSKRSSSYENLLVTGCTQSADENPNVSITVNDQVMQNLSNGTELVIRSKEHEHPKIAVPEGNCIDAFCTTCPISNHESDKKSQEKRRRDHSHQGAPGADPQFHKNIHDEEPKNWIRKLLSMMSQLIPRVQNPHTKFVHWWNKIFIISCLLATFVDPLFFFLLSVEKENKCISIDWTFAWAIVGLRSITDLVYLLHIFLQFRLAYISRGSPVVGSSVLVADPKKIACNYLRGWFLMDLFVVLPLPQLVTFVVPASHTFNSANDMKNILRLVVLFQCLPRLCRFLPMLAGQSTTGFIFETAWANFVINLFSFVLAGHIVGSCWYLFGFQRVNHCLKDACHDSNMTLPLCKNLSDCGHVSKYEDFGSRRNPDLWRNNARAIACFSQESFQYGIYLQAVNLTTESSVGTRYVYSLFWGFQQLSTLAGNQTPSYYYWEVLFTMSIVGLGLLLFALLIGNIQNFLQALGKRRFEMMLRRRDVDQWMSHRRLPEELTQRVRQAERYNWIANKGVDEEVLMVNLPEDLQTDIRRHQFKFIKEVRIFSALDEHVLDSINERLKEKTYIKGSQIMFPGGQIKKITFIVSGKMKSIGDDMYEAELSRGDVCGEELLSWCLEDSFKTREGNSPRAEMERTISNRRVTCLTNVEVFTLAAADLKEVNRLIGYFLQRPRIQDAIRKNFAAKCIQVAWRNRNIRLDYCKAAPGGVSRCLIPFQRDARGYFGL